MLTATPELLLPGLTLIGRQTETPGGPLDLLGIDDDGRLVVFELKRGNLTREAVAQAIDYASYLATLQPEELARHVRKNSGKSGSDQIEDFEEEDFAQWYQNHFQRTVAEIGPPRIMLVGLGVEDRAKRMVAFLAQSEVDISLITFHGFKLGDETLLARQVEVGSEQPEGVTHTKRENQAKLDKLLVELGIKDNYNALVSAAKDGLGDSAYQWPNATGCSFSLPGISSNGTPTNHAYFGLYAPREKNGKIQVLLQPRAVSAAGGPELTEFEKAMASVLSHKASGSADLWIDGRKSGSTYRSAIEHLTQAITAGWKSKQEEQAKEEEAAAASA